MISKKSSFAEWKVSSHSIEGEKMRAIVPKSRWSQRGKTKQFQKIMQNFQKG